MGIVLQFQSLPRGRRQSAAAPSSGKTDSREKTGKIVIFPGIRMDREQRSLLDAEASHRQANEGPAE